MSTTAANLITAAFSKIGIASPSAAQNASALISLNTLVSFFGASFMFPFLVRESKTLTVGDGEYTIGVGGNLNTVRPIGLENCYLRDSDNYDYPLKVLSPSDYAKRPNKTLTSKPQRVYFIPEYPLAKIIFDYLPDYAYTAYFDFRKNLTEFALSSTTMESTLLPEEYRAFLTYNLAISLAEDWDRTPSKTLYAMAQQTKETIETLIASTKPAPVARFDVTKSEEAGTYSIITDDVIDGGAF